MLHVCRNTANFWSATYIKYTIDNGLYPALLHWSEKVMWRLGPEMESEQYPSTSFSI
jgi:hypothetical protein